jgi:tripartite-type tricarboxylate transporter receptor subunit TctC
MAWAAAPTHIKSGRLRAIAVAGDRRAPGFPDVPTAAEAGVPTYKVATWYGIWAPKGSPREATTAMQAEMRKALNSRRSQGHLDEPGHRHAQPVGRRTSAALSAAKIKRWAEVVKGSGAKLD